MQTLEQSMLERGIRARAAAEGLRNASAEARTHALKALADGIRANADTILAANQRDLEAGRANGMGDAMLDRLALNPDRIEGIASAVAIIAGVKTRWVSRQNAGSPLLTDWT